MVFRVPIPLGRLSGQVISAETLTAFWMSDNSPMHLTEADRFWLCLSTARAFRLTMSTRRGNPIDNGEPVFRREMAVARGHRDRLVTGEFLDVSD